LNERQDALGKELTEQMGRPITYTPKEVTTAVARGEYMVKISEEALKETEGEAEKGFKRYIKKVPVGPVLILFPWNVSNSIHCSELITTNDFSTHTLLWSTR
jgi:acyl-CoA reductase-like NAD-dependent aldehyde dehydrogenase